MKLIRGITSLSVTAEPCVATIGNFDGVHLGHQMVISTLVAEARRRGVNSTVITFDPLAREYFAPDASLRVQTVEQRLADLTALGVEQVLLIDFNQEFASYPPEQFIQEILVDGLRVKSLSIGDDFRFGHQRAGDFALLRDAGQRFGFSVNAHDTFRFDGERVSSGRLRDAIKQGDFSGAADLLGHSYTIVGTVCRGDQRGREIDFPTANILLDSKRFAVHGVYAVIARLTDGRGLYGVANVGQRPTVGGVENRLEVHLFDFNQDIYGQELAVEFVQKIRDEKKFESFSTLREQINLDAQFARSIFTKNSKILSI